MSNARNLANLLGTNTTIQTAKLADSAISTAKLADSAISTAKLATDAVTSPRFQKALCFLVKASHRVQLRPTPEPWILLSTLLTSKKYRMYMRNFWVNDGKQIRIYKLSAANTPTTSLNAYGGGTYQGEGVTGELQYSNAGWYNPLSGSTTVQSSANGAYRCNGVLDIVITNGNQLVFTEQLLLGLLVDSCNINSGCIGIDHIFIFVSNAQPMGLAKN